MKLYEDRVNYYGHKRIAILVDDNEHYKWAASITGTDSVLDVGAGFCDLRKFLPPNVIYSAIDNTESVCKAGGAVLQDIMDCKVKADYVCALGILETTDDLYAMAIKLKSLALKAVLTTIINKTNNSVFKAYTQKQITDAFGPCEFIVNRFNTYIICKV